MIDWLRYWASAWWEGCRLIARWLSGRTGMTQQRRIDSETQALIDSWHESEDVKP